MKSLLVRLSSLVAATSGAWFVQPALAQSECAADSDCEHGYQCQVTGASGCAAAPCAAGEDCAEPEPCEAETFSSCVPASDCESDDDCADHMACETYTSGSCTSAAPAPCAPDAEVCAPIAPEPVCEDIVETQCVEKWNLACEADLDCGEGFDCVVAEEDCACTGGTTPGTEPAPPEEDPAADDIGGGEMPSDDGSDDASDDGASDDVGADETDSEGPAPDVITRPAPPVETCECVQSDVKYCQLREVECQADSDCPSDWTCTPQSSGASCGGMATDPGSAPAPAPADEPAMGGSGTGTGAAPIALLPPEDSTDDGDGDMVAPAEDGGVSQDPPECEPVVTRSICMPPGYYGSPTGPSVPGSDNGAGEPTSGEGEEPREDDASSDDAVDPDPNPAPGGGEPDAGAVEEPEEDTAELPVEEETPPATEDSDDDGDEEPATPADDDAAEEEPVADNDAGAEDEEEEADSGKKSNSSCSVADAGASQTSSGAWLLGLLGLSLLRRRR